MAYPIAMLIGFTFLVAGAGMAFGVVVGGYVALAVGVLYIAAAATWDF